MCENGLEHVYWVKFEQINSTGTEGVAFLEGQCNFGGNPCMEVVALMSGAQGEEAHQEYKEGDGSHRGHVFHYYFDMVCMTSFCLQLFSEVYCVV